MGSPLEFRATIRPLVEHFDDQGKSEGKVRDLLYSALKSKTIDAEGFGLTRAEAWDLAVAEISDVYTCEHGRRDHEECIQCRGISSKDRQVVRLISEGLSTEDIAEEMFVSRYTVRARIRRLRALVGGQTMQELPSLVRSFEGR